jgi:hypothetical protein
MFQIDVNMIELILTVPVTFTESGEQAEQAVLDRLLHSSPKKTLHFFAALRKLSKILAVKYPNTCLK